MRYVEIDASVAVHPTGAGKIAFTSSLDGLALIYTAPTALRPDAQVPNAYIDYLSTDDLRGIAEAALTVVKFVESDVAPVPVRQSLATTAYNESDRIVIGIDGGVADVSLQWEGEETVWLESVTPDSLDSLAALFAEAASTLRSKGSE